MRNSLSKVVKAEISKLIIFQLLIIMGFTLMLLLFTGIENASSAFAGSLSYWIPQVGFIWLLSAKAHARAVLSFTLHFFVGEGIKLFLSGFLFVLAVKYLHADFLWAMMGLAAAIVAFWLASFFSLYSVGEKS